MLRNKIKNCFDNQFGKCAILLLLINAYHLLGAFLFIYTETCYHEKPLERTNQSLPCRCQELVNAMRINNSIMSNDDDFLNLRTKILEICKNVGHCKTMTVRTCSFDGDTILKWCLFCWNTISTIGYGSTVPTTKAGKICVMPYSGIGIVLVLVFLSMSGSILKKYISKWIIFLETLVTKTEEVSYKETKVLFATIIITATRSLINAHFYSYLTGVDLLTSFYFYYVTFTTIGYGDYDLNVILENHTWGFLTGPLFWLGLTGTSTLVQAVTDVIQYE